MTDVQVSQEPAQAALPQATPHRIRSVQVLTVLGFAVPIAVYLWYLQHFTRNVIAGDQWSDVSLIRASYQGHLSLGTLWAQHNENRILFPNLIVLALSRVTALNITVEEYVSTVFLFAAVALIVLAHRRRSPDSPWIAYCPVVILMLSIVQGGNTLWGFQLAWFLILTALAGVIFLLDDHALSVAGFVAAIAVAVIGSFSSFQGLLIWVAGLLLLYYRRRRPLFLGIWVGAAALTTIVYFYHLNSNEAVAPWLTASHFPLKAVRFYFVSIGDVLGIPLTKYDLGANFALVIGLVIVGLALYSLWAYGRRRDTESAAPVGIVLIVVGLLFAASTTWGRTWAGPPAASASRYTTYDLLVLVGTYLTYLSAFRRPARSQTHSRSRMLVGILLGTAIVLQVTFGFVNGIRWARANDRYLVTFGAVTVHATQIPKPLISTLLLYEGYSNQALLDDIKLLAAHHLSLFSDPAAVRSYQAQADLYARSGMFVYHAPQPTSVVIPQNGAVVSGRTLLAASAVPILGPKRVTFELSGPSMLDRVLGTAHRSASGWLLAWQSSTVPNGTYDLRSVVVGASDRVTRSASISITVHN